MIKPVVLDASALLAYLQDEKGCEKVDEALSQANAVMSTVNYAEVVGKLLEAGLPASSVEVVMDKLELQVEPLDKEQAWEIGKLRTETRGLGLSLGDRACLALAGIKNLSVITADKQWDKLQLDLEIIQLR